MRMVSRNELNRMESLSQKMGPLSHSPAGFMLGLPSRRWNMNVQWELVSFDTRVQHGSNFRRDLPWAAGQKHILQVNSWRGSPRICLFFSLSYLPLFLQLFPAWYISHMAQHKNLGLHEVISLQVGIVSQNNLPMDRCPTDHKAA